ncbi:DUF6225 family protein [Saccharopolyspora sp. NPDC050389]|uniref:DUF6225 family protein n=1 Tax=Saccharopolyspora sp. NPDC050389 TaxID=3155516 RepID=UPI0033DA95D8
MTIEQTETFKHVVQPWTVGELRKALAGLRDDLPISVWTTSEPDGPTVEERVITHVGFGKVDEGDGWHEDRTYLGISVDFPSGEYSR